MSSAGEQGGQSQPPRRTAPSWLSQAPEKLWEEQLASQFKARSAGAAINTIVEWPSVNHVPVRIGALPSSPRLIKVAEGGVSGANFATGSTAGNWRLRFA